MCAVERLDRLFMCGCHIVHVVDVGDVEFAVVVVAVFVVIFSAVAVVDFGVIVQWFSIISVVLLVLAIITGFIVAAVLRSFYVLQSVVSLLLPV